MQRKKPVTRGEIRLTDRGQIATLPADSVRLGRRIDKLWSPLVEILQREQVAANAWRRKENRDAPIRWPAPTWPGIERACRRCGRRFYNAMRCRGAYCSNRCISAASSAKIAKAESIERAAARAGLKCQTCGMKLFAMRSTAKFCSVGCRVTAHRMPASSNASLRKLLPRLCSSAREGSFEIEGKVVNAISVGKRDSERPEIAAILKGRETLWPPGACVQDSFLPMWIQYRTWYPVTNASGCGD
jgi:hypothetical protein